MITLDIHGNTASICIDGVWRMVTPEIAEKYPWTLKYLRGTLAAEVETKMLLDDIDAACAHLKP